MMRILLLLMVMLGLGACAQNKSFDNMDVPDFATYVADDNIQLLDVRTADEYAEGHIHGSVNIDIFNDKFLDIAENVLDKSKPVAVYCRSGKRSADAARRLSAKGYKVTNLNGGILAWINEKMPVDCP